MKAEREKADRFFKPRGTAGSSGGKRPSVFAEYFICHSNGVADPRAAYSCRKSID